MIPVIISGGSGSRLWPISRSSFPKQFCEIFDEPLLEHTIKRLSQFKAPLIVTVESLKVLTERCALKAHLSSKNIVYEPIAKNTAPAIALICHLLKLEGLEQQVIGVFPADHMIIHEERFLKIVSHAERVALQGTVVTLGVKPHYPATGFGYIQCREPQHVTAINEEIRSVIQFVEKPDLQTAESFLASGDYYWNAGMFVFKVDVMIEAFKTHLPDMWSQITKIKSDKTNIKDIYGNLEAISFDKGIMEKISDQMCIPTDIGWSDLGSWDDYAKMMEQGMIAKGVSKANIVSVDSNNNFILSLKPKKIALLGVENLFVVNTDDAILIGQRGRSQDTKKIVEILESQQDKSLTDHNFDHRPWGMYDVISDDNEFKIKVIAVNPGQQLSYQSHTQRSEHWVIIDGKGEVIINEQVLSVYPGSSIVIPVNSKHRIRNTGAKVLRFVEVQTGEYFGEEDIQRFEDDYKRV